ncbi:MAG: ABC transporter substrate-binding protein [Pseudaminobacter sp.]
MSEHIAKARFRIGGLLPAALFFSLSLLPLPALAQDQPKKGGTMVMVATGDPGQFNIAISTNGLPRRVSGNIFSGLTFIGEDLTAQPDLATTWETPDDGKTWTFHLAQGVHWHDGAPFSSADVKYSFEEVLIKYHPTTRAGLADLLESIETPDDHTVVFHFNRPYAPLPLRLGNIDAPILPKHLYEGTDPLTNPANQTPVGTGPFKLGAYNKGSSVELVRNDNYFKEGLPYLDRLVLSIVPDASQQVAALLQGELDYIPAVSPAFVKTLEANPNITLKPTISNGHGALNCQNLMTYNIRGNKHLADKTVRQALAYAIDRERIVEQVTFGQAKVATGPIASAFDWARPADLPSYTHNPAKANELLDSAGKVRGDDGLRFSLSMHTTASNNALVEIVKENLAEVGINLEVNIVDGNAANEAVFVTHAADLGIWGSCNASDPDIGIPPLYVSTNIYDSIGANTAGYDNPALDAEFRAAASTTDMAVRAQHYQNVVRILVEDMPYLWLFEQRNISALNARLRDVSNWSANQAERAWFSD